MTTIGAARPAVSRRVLVGAAWAMSFSAIAWVATAVLVWRVVGR